MCSTSPVFTVNADTKKLNQSLLGLFCIKQPTVKLYKKYSQIGVKYRHIHNSIARRDRAGNRVLERGDILFVSRSRSRRGRTLCRVARC
eukprot:scaffold944_cov115-Alexandrium_tamarense.AAC.28